MHRAIKKYFLLFFITINGAISAYCQQDPRSSFYMQNIGAYNPGYVGSQKQGDALLDFNQPFGQFKDGAGNNIQPNTWWLNANAPLSKLNSGIGINTYVDKNGLFETNTHLALQYAYQLEIGDGKLGIGANIGFNKLSYDFSKAVYPSDVSTGSGGTDQSIENLKKQKSINPFNLGLGAYYQKDNIYFGFSMTNINSPKLKINQEKLKYFIPHAYFLAGFTYHPTNPLLVIMPSMQYKSPINGKLKITGSQLSISTIVEYSKFILVGAQYSTGNELTAMLGANIKNGSKYDGARFLLAYNIIGSKLGGLSGMKFEAIVGYSFNLHIEKNTKTYKSVRFL